MRYKRFLTALLGSKGTSSFQTETSFFSFSRSHGVRFGVAVQVVRFCIDYGCYALGHFDRAKVGRVPLIYVTFYCFLGFV